jgi:aryl-phospho-beta-D-glucosidase BglC (GH1 family)
MADTGANLARIIVPLKHCDACPGFEIAASDIAYVDRVVAMGEKYGFYVVLTLSPRPAGDKAKYWKNAELKRSIRDVWVQLASRYRGRVGIAAYDLINEPVPQVWFDAEDAWREFASSLIEAIRKSDPDHVIVVEPINWGHASGMTGWKPLPYANLVYSFHFYEPYGMTHQGLEGNKRVIAYPNADWDKKRLSMALEPARVFARTYKVPVLVGEFSIVRWAPGNSVQNYLRDVIDLFEHENWPWLYHAFREYPGWDAEIPGAAERDPPNRKNARTKHAPLMQMLRQRLERN